MALPFEFAVLGIPVSAQASTASKLRWKRVVLQFALGRWPVTSLPIAAEISATVIYFHVGETDLDIDNIAKPLLDALVGTVYVDDGLVSQVLLRKTRLQAGTRIVNPSGVLAMALASWLNQDFVYVRVGDPPNHMEIP